MKMTITLTEKYQSSNLSRPKWRARGAMRRVLAGRVHEKGVFRKLRKRLRNQWITIGSEFRK
jgi:hypothetical protein